MPQKKKSWTDKMKFGSKPKFVTLDKKFADIPENGLMVITTPEIILEYLKEIPKGQTKTISQIRSDLASQLGAEFTCPVTTGIFLRIIAEYEYERLQNGEKIENIAPFWRVFDPDAKPSQKLSFDLGILRQKREEEGI